MKNIKGTVIVFLLAGFAGGAIAQQRPYGLKDETPETGTLIRRERVHGALPFDKTYAQLSPGQKAQLKQRYENLGESDEPPYPAGGLKGLYSVINQANQSLLAEGYLEMQVLIDVDGKATRVDVYHSPDPEITNAVARLAMLTTYKPGVINGKPAAMVFPIDIEFKIVH